MSLRESEKHTGAHWAAKRMMGLLREVSPSGRKTHHCYFTSAVFVFLASLTCLKWAETKVLYYGSNVEEYQMKEMQLFKYTVL